MCKQATAATSPPTPLRSARPEGKDAAVLPFTWMRAPVWGCRSAKTIDRRPDRQARPDNRHEEENRRTKRRKSDCHPEPRLLRRRTSAIFSQQAISTNIAVKPDPDMTTNASFRKPALSESVPKLIGEHPWWNNPCTSRAAAAYDSSARECREDKKQEEIKSALADDTRVK